MKGTELSFGGKLANVTCSQAARLKQSQATVLLGLWRSTRSRFQSQPQNNVAGTGQGSAKFCEVARWSINKRGSNKIDLIVLSREIKEYHPCIVPMQGYTPLFPMKKQGMQSFRPMPASAPKPCVPASRIVMTRISILVLFYFYLYSCCDHTDCCYCSYHDYELPLPSHMKAS